MLLSMPLRTDLAQPGNLSLVVIFCPLVRLSRASGVPIEQFVGDEEEED